MQPVGYVVMQHAVRLDRPVKAYARWMHRVPSEYRQQILGIPEGTSEAPDDDEHCLAQLRHYRSLMPLAMEARKPMFMLRPGDGAIGSHQDAVTKCYRDFNELARRIAERCQIP